MSGLDLVFSIDPVAVRIRAQVLEMFDIYRQRRFFQREAGGQLFARIRGNEWDIVAATGPRAKDRRSRFSFRPHRSSEQDEIFKHHERGLDYVGDWHTHPEDIPTRSANDISSIGEVVQRSIHQLPGFLLLIVGRKPFPKGLSASFHSVEGNLAAAGDIRFGNDGAGAPTI